MGSCKAGLSLLRVRERFPPPPRFDCEQSGMTSLVPAGVPKSLGLPGSALSAVRLQALRQGIEDALELLETCGPR